MFTTRVILVFALASSAGSAAMTAQEAKDAVDSALDRLHHTASVADFEGYFGLYTDDAVFLGTDATERWTKAEFMAYAKPHFDRGRGWTYVPTERYVYLSDDGRVAWFDERLENAFLGDTRGTGVLVLTDDGWRVAHYNLSIPIPNDVASEVVTRIREAAAPE